MGEHSKITYEEQSILLAKLLDCFDSKVELADYLGLSRQNLQKCFRSEARLNRERVHLCYQYLAKNYLELDAFIPSDNPFDSSLIKKNMSKKLTKETATKFTRRIMGLVRFAHPDKILEKDFEKKLRIKIKKYWPYIESQFEEDTGLDAVAISLPQSPDKTVETSD